MSCLTVMNVVAALIWQDGRFLAALRPAGKIMGGYWELPGGKMETGETPQAALARELYEELGIKVRKAALWQEREHKYAKENLVARLHFFNVEEISGTPSGMEGQQLAWILPAEWTEYKFLPADVSVLRELPYR